MDSRMDLRGKAHKLHAMSHNKNDNNKGMPTEQEIMLPFISIVGAFRKGGFDFTQATAGMVYVFIAFVMPGAKQADIAQAAGLTKAVVSRSCSYLVSEGYITCVRDGHAKLCKLTAKGRRLKARVLEAACRAERDARHIRNTKSTTRNL